MSISSKFWLIFTLMAATAFAADSNLPPFPELPKIDEPEMGKSPEPSDLPIIPSLPQEEAVEGSNPFTPMPSKKVDTPVAAPSFPIPNVTPVITPKPVNTLKPVVPANNQAQSKPVDFKDPIPVLPSEGSISGVRPKTSDVLPTQTAQAATIADQLQVLIDKTVTSSHLSKYEIGILSDILIQENEEMAEGVEGLIPEKILLDKEGRVVSDLTSVSRGEDYGYKAQLAQLDKQIEGAKGDSKKLAALEQKKREVQLTHRFHLSYSKQEIQPFPDKVNEKDNKHLPAKDTIVYYRPYIYQAIAENNLSKLQELLDFISYQDFLDDHGNNLVMKAAMYNNQRILEYLVLNHNFSIHTANNYNATPLHVAAHNGNYAMVKFLLANYASILIEDQAGYTPMDYALASGSSEVVNLFDIIDREIRLGDAGEE